MHISKQLITKNIGCIIMASGVGKRFGGNKLMADFSGNPLISHIIHTVKNTSITNCVVVTRHSDVANLCKKYNMEVLLHNMSLRNDVIRLGLAFFADTSLDGYMFCPADQPLLTAQSIEKLILSFCQQPEKIHRLCFQEEPGSPVIFPAKFLKELYALPEGKGGGYLTRQHADEVIYVPVSQHYELKDIDTMKDLDSLLHIFYTL